MAVRKFPFSGYYWNLQNYGFCKIYFLKIFGSHILKSQNFRTGIFQEYIFQCETKIYSEILAPETFKYISQKPLALQIAIISILNLFPIIILYDNYLSYENLCFS